MKVQKKPSENNGACSALGQKEFDVKIELLEEITKGLLQFASTEMRNIARYRGITVYELMLEEDYSLYREPADVYRDKVVRRMFDKGFDMEIMKEITGMREDSINTALGLKDELVVEI